jgi:ABC-type Mn2+/Zn2+ transport system permease subunit
MNWLLEPMQYEFMHHALLAGVLVGATCAALGVHVVLRRMSFLGEAVAHSTLPGIVVAFMNQWSLIFGALLASVFTAVGVGWLSRRRGQREDSAIGVLLTAMLALGVVLMSHTRSYRDFSHMLFGNILGVVESDLYALLAIAVVVLGVLALIHKELVLTAVDPVQARAIGLSPDRVRMGLLILVSLAVVAGVQAVGVIMTTALLVTPASAAVLLTRRLLPAMAISVTIAIVSAIVGLYLSYHLSVSSGGAIVLVSSACYALALVASRLVAHDDGTAALRASNPRTSGSSDA